MNAPAVVRKVELLLTAGTLDLKRPGLKQGVTGLKEAFQRKAELFDKYKAESGALKKAMQEVRAQAGLGGEAGALASKVWEYYAEPTEAGGKDLNGKVEESLRRNQTAPENLQVNLTTLAEAVRLVTKHRPAEEVLAVRLSFLTTSERVNALARGLDQEFQAALQDKDLYGIYLVYYSGALLLLLGYLGMHLRQSYAAIQQLNLALKEANEGLERKVAGRTAELSRPWTVEGIGDPADSDRKDVAWQMVAGISP